MGYVLTSVNASAGTVYRHYLLVTQDFVLTGVGEWAKGCE